MSAVAETAGREPATSGRVPVLAGRHAEAGRDLREAASLWRLCWTLGWLDIKLRYRGSILGPFWLTLSTAVMVGAMGGIYATLFNMNLHEYLPFLVLSLVLWNFLSALVGDACVGFTASEAMIRSVRMPFTLYAARIVLRNVLVLAHNLVVVVAVFAIFDSWPGLRGLLALPGYALWLLDSFALTILLGALCARFRDIPPIVASVRADGVLRHADHLEAGTRGRRAAVADAVQPVLRPDADRARAAAGRDADADRMRLGGVLFGRALRRHLVPVRPRARPHRVLGVAP